RHGQVQEPVYADESDAGLGELEIGDFHEAEYFTVSDPFSTSAPHVPTAPDRDYSDSWGDAGNDELGEDYFDDSGEFESLIGYGVGRAEHGGNMYQKAMQQQGTASPFNSSPTTHKTLQHQLPVRYNRATAATASAIPSPYAYPYQQPTPAKSKDSPLPLRHSNPMGFGNAGNKGRGKVGESGDGDPNPVVLGIRLKAVSCLPDRYRSIFPFQFFNAVQSDCYDQILHSDVNMVVSAPTELAIINLLMKPEGDQAKVIYMAPTKALCGERAKDWQKKFRTLGIECKELTGDTDNSNIQDVQRANIIVTTPEKWDSMTRRWTDHKHLMGLIRLFMLDEVHMLNEQKRGATMEVVVSRMRTVGHETGSPSRGQQQQKAQKIRLIGLSATVPNIEDVAVWLRGADGRSATVKVFGEEFRPVRLQKHVMAVGVGTAKNAFMFERCLDYKLMEVIQKYSDGKPTLVFCATRKGAMTAAEHLVTECQAACSGGTLTYGHQHPFVKTRDKAEMLRGVAGRVKEKKLAGTTSTLAVGVNLPAHLVVIKGTNTYNNGRLMELSELDILQMLGRAGRPQFDDSGVAVIMTTTEHEKKYEAMVAGQQIIESSLHQNLIEHLNAEVVLCTITNVNLAIEWLKSSFLYVRIRQNPHYYKIKNSGPSSKQSAEGRLEEICVKDLELLSKHGIVVKQGDNSIVATEYGKVMAKYYLRFETVKKLVELKPAASPRDVFECICKAEEFVEVRYHQDKTHLNALNKNAAMRFPIKGKIKDAGDKVNSEYLCHEINEGLDGTAPHCALGSIPFTDQKTANTLAQETHQILKHASRIARGAVDLMVAKQDFRSLKSALDISKSVQAKTWENSTTLLKQIEGVGPQLAKLLAQKNITTFEKLMQTEARQLEFVLNRNPPFGNKLLDQAAAFPRFTMKIVQYKEMSRKVTALEFCVTLGLLNPEKVKTYVRHSSASVVFVAGTTSSNTLLDFRKMPMFKLKDGITFRFQATLKQQEKIACSVVSEDYVGLDIHKEVVPDMKPLSLLLRANSLSKQPNKASASAVVQRTNSNSERRTEPATKNKPANDDVDDMFDLESEWDPRLVMELDKLEKSLNSDGKDGANEGIKKKKEIGGKSPCDLETNYTDMFGEIEWDDEQLDALVNGAQASANASPKQKSKAKRLKPSTLSPATPADDTGTNDALQPGYVPCKHFCKNKKTCTHKCCKIGVPIKKAKKRKKASTTSNDNERDGLMESSLFMSDSDDDVLGSQIRQPKRAKKQNTRRLAWTDSDDDELNMEPAVEPDIQAETEFDAQVAEDPTNVDDSINFPTRKSRKKEFRDMIPCADDGDDDDLNDFQSGFGNDDREDLELLKTRSIFDVKRKAKTSRSPLLAKLSEAGKQSKSMSLFDGPDPKAKRGSEADENEKDGDGNAKVVASGRNGIRDSKTSSTMQEQIRPLGMALAEKPGSDDTLHVPPPAAVLLRKKSPPLFFQETESGMDDYIDTEGFDLGLFDTIDLPSASSPPTSHHENTSGVVSGDNQATAKNVGQPQEDEVETDMHETGFIKNNRNRSESLPYAAPVPPKPLATEALHSPIKKLGLSDAVDNYRKTQTAQAPSLALGRGVLNSLGGSSGGGLLGNGNGRLQLPTNTLSKRTATEMKNEFGGGLGCTTTMGLGTKGYGPTANVVGVANEKWKAFRKDLNGEVITAGAGVGAGIGVGSVSAKREDRGGGSMMIRNRTRSGGVMGETTGRSSVDSSITGTGVSRKLTPHMADGLSKVDNSAPVMVDEHQQTTGLHVPGNIRASNASVGSSDANKQLRQGHQVHHGQRQGRLNDDDGRESKPSKVDAIQEGNANGNASTGHANRSKRGSGSGTESGRMMNTFEKARRETLSFLRSIRAEDFFGGIMR
ncbi:Sec63, partial [Quaeritorhiza haematococci]